jgi:hypothetical protein
VVEVVDSIGTATCGGGQGNTVSGTTGSAGTDGLGGGGGGGAGNAPNTTGSGGDGVVIIRYTDDGSITATGGTVTTITGYKVHTFPTGTTNFNVIGSGTLEYLVIAGGGGGASGGGGN